MPFSSLIGPGSTETSLDPASIVFETIYSYSSNNNNNNNNKNNNNNNNNNNNDNIYMYI